MHACLLVSVYIICLFVADFAFKENQSTAMIVEFRDLLSSRWSRVSERASVRMKNAMFFSLVFGCVKHFLG
jgi:hypothetical protein